MGLRNILYLIKASFSPAELFDELMKNEKWDVKQRFGANGKHGSLAVTERVVKTLKYEWFIHVPIIKGFDHLSKFCEECAEWYNGWRPHMFLNGDRPGYVLYNWVHTRPRKDDKVIPMNIKKKRSEETHVIGYVLDEAA